MTLVERLVVERKSDHRRTWFINGKRVSFKEYRDASAACSTFDTHQTTSDRTHYRFYSVGRK